MMRRSKGAHTEGATASAARPGAARGQDARGHDTKAPSLRPASRRTAQDRPPRRSRTRIVAVSLMVAGALLVLSAAVLAGVNVVLDARAGSAAASVLEEFPVQAQAIDSSSLDPEASMPAVKIQDNDYIGVVAVPALDLELPVMSNWSYARLDIAPCRYSGSAYADDLVIAGHSYRSHFSPLWQLSGGEEVIFTDTVGNVFTYEVTSVETVQPTDIEFMVGDPDDADKGWDLTLFTCTYDSRARVAVRCSKTE